MSGPCACGHVREAHRHFRPGSDCGICGAGACPRYDPGSRLARLRSVLPLRRGRAHRPG